MATTRTISTVKVLRNGPNASLASKDWPEEMPVEVVWHVGPFETVAFSATPVSTTNPEGSE